MRPADERSLIEAAKRDRRQFAGLYEANFDRVYAYAMSRLRDKFSSKRFSCERPSAQAISVRR